MLASLSQAVYLLNAPISQVARLAGALQAKAEQDPTILAGGASQESSQESSTGPVADAAEETPAAEETEEAAPEATDEATAETPSTEDTATEA
jgi:large subunit ribosomal protein L10